MSVSKGGGECPVFIGGLFKSGTSLLRAMLGQHPEFASGLETYWFDFQPGGQRGPRGEPWEEFVQRMAKFFDLEVSEVRTAAKVASGELFLDGLMALVCRRQGKSRWIEKTPGNICQVSRIFAHWPRARFLWIVRDPRDVRVRRQRSAMRLRLTRGMWRRRLMF